MSEEGLVRQAVAAFNARDVEGFIALTTRDFAWRPSMSPVEGAEFHGPDGIRSYFDGLANVWERFEVVPVEIRRHDAGLLVLGRLEGRGRGSGVQVDSPLGMAFDLYEGKICRVRGYLEHRAALEAVGLGAQVRGGGSEPAR
jgi:ketosteroid isomerase-like protein